MHPVLFQLGPVTLSSYGAMVVLAVALFTWLTPRAALGFGRPPVMRSSQWADLACASVIGGILGGRLFYVGLHPQLVMEAPWEMLAVWHGGLVWYGGLAGGLVGAWSYARRHRVPLWALLDVAAPFLALAHALGRIGCFLNGCCYGRPTTAWYGVLFPGHAEPVIPTQLFETAGLLVVFVALRGLQQRPGALRRAGWVFGWYLASYAGLRFGLEFLRGDQSPFLGPLTLQQIISVGLAGIGLRLILRPSCHDG